MEFHSPHPDVNIPNISYHEHILQHADEYGDKPALINGETEQRFTYKQVKDYSRTFASALQRRNISKGDRVLLFLPNCIEFPIIKLGVISAGAIAQALNPLFTSEELLHQVKITDPALIITVPGTPLKTVQQVFNQWKGALQNIITVGKAKGYESFTDLLSEPVPGNQPMVAIDPNKDLAIIAPSSGTTGPSKAICSTHAAHVAASTVLEDLPQCGLPANTDVLVCFSPMFHAFSEAIVAATGLRQGATILVLTDSETHKICQAIDKYKVTVVCCCPPLISQIVHDGVPDSFSGSTLRAWHVTASLLTTEVANVAKKMLNIKDFVISYGSTETSCTTFQFLETHGVENVGVLLPNFKAKIIDLEKNVPLGPNQDGELLIKTKTGMKEYYNNPDATAEVLNEEGWIRTGDIAYFDDGGKLFLKGRIKDMIKYMSYAVSPMDLETTLLSHDCIEDAAVIGIPSDNGMNELPRAYVVKKQGTYITEHDVITFMEGKTVWYKHLRGGVVFVDGIPRAPSGKIQRRKLLDM